MANEELPVTTNKKVTKKNLNVVMVKYNRPNFISVGLLLCGITWFIMSIIILWSIVIEMKIPLGKKLH